MPLLRLTSLAIWAITPCAIIPCAIITSQAKADTSFEYVPRLDVFEKGAKQELAIRLAVDRSGTTSNNSLSDNSLSNNWLCLASYRMRLEGFVTRDFAEQEKKPLGQPDLRKSREESDLTEAWLDFGFQNGVGIRIGRQPIRWSQSWTLPSLDLLTGRRFNRFFLDPLVDQLTHPDAIRLTYSGNIQSHSWDLDIVQVLRSAPFRFAEPVANRDRENLGETAAKLGLKIGLLELAAIGSSKKIAGTSNRELQSGMLASYALENVVLKIETGNSDRDAVFFTFGTDWFLDEWLIGPQLTMFRDRVLGNEGEALIYLPVRYSKERWSIETDLLLGFASPSAADDRFLSMRVGRELREGLILSMGIQNYGGKAGRLLGQAKSILGETVYGFRLEYSGGLSL